MAARVGIGVVGTGRFGRLHLNVFKQLKGCRVVALCDRDAAALSAGGAIWPHAGRVHEIGELLEMPGIDAVDIVTDEAVHASQALAALRAGKHVFVEKPLATTAVDARAVAAVAGEHRRILMVGHISRFSAPYALLHAEVSSGRFGQIVTLRARRSFSRAWFEAFGKRIHPVFESGIHDIDLLLWYAGARCRRVYAASRAPSGLPYPDVFTATLHFGNGVLGMVESAWLVPRAAPATVSGALELEGTIDADLEITGTAQTARLRLADQGLAIWSDTLTRHPDTTLWPLIHGRAGGALFEELTHFLECVREGTPSLVMPVDEAVHGIEVAEAVLRAENTGREMEVG